MLAEEVTHTHDPALGVNADRDLSPVVANSREVHRSPIPFQNERTSPPSQRTCSPVTYAAAALHKNATTAANSSGRP